MNRVVLEMKDSCFIELIIKRFKMIREEWDLMRVLN